MNGQRELHDWLFERVSTVEEDGPLMIVSVGHCSASGQVQELHSINRKNAGTIPWDDPRAFAERVAEMMYNGARRFAAGLQGTQQMALSTVHTGENAGAKQTIRQLPFLVPGAMHAGALGPLGQDAPTPAGVLATGTRWAEIAIQGAIAKDASLAQLMGGLFKDLLTRLDNVEKRGDERGQALFTLLVEFHKQMTAAQWRVLGMEVVKRATPMLPAIIGTATGTDAPQLTEPSFFDAMVESVPPEQLKMMIAGLPQPAGAVAADHLVKAQRRKAARDAEGGGSLSSFERAVADASGEAYDALQGRHKEGKANGAYVTGADSAARIVDAAKGAHVNGTNGHAPAQPTASADEKGEVLDAILASTSVDQIKMLGQAGVIPKELVDKILKIKGGTT